MSFSTLLDDVLIHDEAKRGCFVAETSRFFRALSHRRRQRSKAQLLGDGCAVGCAGQGADAVDDGVKGLLSTLE
ncbi:hypothetical protein D3C85_644000 [compost metagenome]